MTTALQTVEKCSLALSRRHVARAQIRACCLSVHYGQRAALRDVECTIDPGRITAIVGPSGCGKSSFLNSLNRMTDLIPGCRVTGALRIGEQDIHARGVDTIALRRRVGMIFQRPTPFPTSIRRNLNLALKAHGIRPRTARQQMMRQTLEAVGLWDEVKDRLDAAATGLSGGQQQRLCIARALALRPDVLLMDEPCSALDPIASGVVEDLILRLRGRYTVVVVTHNLAQARRVADDAMMFWVDPQRGDSGVLVEAGPAEEIFSDPKNAITRNYIRGLRG